MTVMTLPATPWTNGQTTTDGRFYYDSSAGGVGAWRSTPLPVGGLPAGSIIQWSSNTAPANWLICDGSAVSRSVYSSLFAVIGTTYGTGDGSTTFNLPDLRGRVPVGKNTGTFSSLAGTGGAETHTLTVNEMPAHTHSNIIWSTYSGGNPPTLYSGTTTAANSGTPNTAYNGSTGGGASHNNLQPYLVVNYIIKATAGWTAGDSELATRVGVLEQNPNITGTLTVAGTTTHNGRVLAPNQPAFVATGSGTVFTVNSGAIMPFNTTAVNAGNGFNTSTNRFTAPVAGNYFFTTSIYINNASDAWPAFFKNGAIYSINDHMTQRNGNTNVSVTISAVLQLAANDYVQVGQRPVSVGMIVYGAHCFFSGYLIG